MLLPSSVADAILASPDDPAPRLRFASELRARGEGDRARFLEVSCALAAGDGDGVEACALRRERAALWGVHRDAWCAELGLSPPEATLDRGVITGLSCTIDQLVELAPTALPRSAIDSLTLLVHPCSPVEALAGCEHLARVRHLTLVAADHHDDRTGFRHGHSVEPVVAELLKFPAWGSLRSLTIDEQAQTPAGFIDSLAPLRSLRSLTLTGQTITGEDARRLASFCWVPGLEALDLRNTDLSDDGLLALVAASGGGLRTLGLGVNPLGLAALVWACGALRLEALDLARSGLGASSLARLLRLPALAGLGRLGLSGNALDADALGAVASLPVLRRLDLSACGLTGGLLAGWSPPAAPLPWRSLDLGHNALGEAGAARLASLPLPGLAELHLPDTGLDDAAVDALAARASWPALRELSVGQPGVSAEGLAGLLRWPGLASLRRLSLAGDRLDGALAGALAGCERLGELEELSLQFTDLDDEVAPSLASSPHLRSLRSIELRTVSPQLAFLDGLRGRPGLLRLQASESLSEGHYKTDSFALARDGLGDAPIDLCFGSQRLGDDDLEALFASKNLAMLVTLVLGWHGFGERGALALARATHLRRLRALCLAGNPVGSRAVGALLRSPAGARLHCLNLRDCALDDDALRALAGAPGGEHLKNLYLCENPLTAAGLGELVSSPRLKTLEILHLATISLGSAGASQLFERACLPGLRVLNMASTGVDDEALRVLARNADMPSLEYLRMPGNPIAGPGIEALVHGGHFRGLTHLTLRSCQLDDRAALALASSPHLGSLRFLALSDNRITDQGALALARSKNLPALEALSLHDNPVGNPGRKALKRRGFDGAV